MRISLQVPTLLLVLHLRDVSSSVSNAAKDYEDLDQSLTLFVCVHERQEENPLTQASALEHALASVAFVLVALAFLFCFTTPVISSRTCAVASMLTGAAIVC